MLAAPPRFALSSLLLSIVSREERLRHCVTSLCAEIKGTLTEHRSAQKKRSMVSLFGETPTLHPSRLRWWATYAIRFCPYQRCYHSRPALRFQDHDSPRLRSQSARPKMTVISCAENSSLQNVPWKSEGRAASCCPEKSSSSTVGKRLSSSKSDGGTRSSMSIQESINVKRRNVR